MKKLLKIYELQTPWQYFEMIVDSVINGNRTQAKEQFKAMPRANQKEFIVFIYSSDCCLNFQEKSFFMNLI